MYENRHTAYGWSMERRQDKMVRISATIPEDIVEKFKEYCKQERRSMSAQITFLMEKALEQKEEEEQQKQKKD